MQLVRIKKQPFHCQRNGRSVFHRLGYSWITVYRQERVVVLFCLFVFLTAEVLVVQVAKTQQKIQTRNKIPPFTRRYKKGSAAKARESSIQYHLLDTRSSTRQQIVKSQRKHGKGAVVLLLVSCSSSSISVREASSARGGTSAFNCPGGTFFIDFVHKILGHFPREAVESATLDAFSERSAPVPPACVPWASVLNVSHLSWP